MRHRSVTPSRRPYGTDLAGDVSTVRAVTKPHHRSTLVDRVAPKQTRRAEHRRRTSSKDPRYFLDTHGRQHFNFPQSVWLERSVPMAFTAVPSTALRTLAVNLLTLVIHERDYRAAIGRTSKLAITLAPYFVQQCLLGAPNAAWILPRETIRSWMESRIRDSVDRRTLGAAPRSGHR